MPTEAETPVNESAQSEEGEPAPASEDRYIRIDPDNLYGDLARQLQERPDFAQAVKTVAGTRVKREADARIRELEAELEGLTVAQQRRRFESMDEDERAQALSDPNVAAEYAEVMRKQAPNPQAIKQANAVNNAVETALDDLRDIGAPEERIETWRNYLRDPKSPFDRSSPAAFVRAVQRAVDMEVHTPESERYAKYGYGKAPAPVAQEEEPEEQPVTPVVAANPRLARGAPDTSRPDGGGNRQRYHTFAEASQMLQSDLREGRKDIKQVTRELRQAKATLPPF